MFGMLLLVEVIPMTAEQRFTMRIPQEDYDKLRVVAAMQGISINSAVRDIVSEFLERWESEHGPVQVLPK